MSKIQSAGSVAGKETIYVDIDDEITSVIDKVQSAKSKVVALVLPKRASVLQSIVNMKLLKRTADAAEKNLVLVTTEAGLMPLAGSVGLYVADTPTSKPVIPPAPAGPSDEPEDLDEPLDIVDSSAEEPATEDFDPKTASEKPVGELAAAGVAGKIAEADIDESIDMDDEAAPAAAAAAKGAPKPKKNKKLAVPNFDSFKKKLLLAGGIVALLVVLLIVALVVLPKATITVHTDSSTVQSNLNLVLDTTATSLNTSNNLIPAIAQSQQKTSTQQVPATGQQNNGQKAQGAVKFAAKVCTQPIGTPPPTIPAYSSVTTGGNTYITQSDMAYGFTGFSSGGSCANYSTNSSNIVALKGGSNFNTGDNATFSGPNSASGTGSASGGTDNITKIVAQADIDGATAKIKAADSSSIKQQLTSGLQSKGLQAIQTTFLASDPQVTTSAKAGDAADSVTVTAVTNYTMLGVKKSDLKTVVDSNVNNQIDKSKQVILDDGIANAVYTQQAPATATNATVAMSVKSVAGPQLDTASLQKQLAGKKTGDVKSLLGQTPGVTSVDVKYSPFWVNSVPKSAAKIHLQIDKPSTKQ